MGNKLNKYIKQIPFPECCKWCRIIEELGAGECEYVCPERFKKRKGGLK